MEFIRQKLPLLLLILLLLILMSDIHFSGQAIWEVNRDAGEGWEHSSLHQANWNSWSWLNLSGFMIFLFGYSLLMLFDYPLNRHLSSLHLLLLILSYLFFHLLILKILSWIIFSSHIFVCALNERSPPKKEKVYDDQILDDLED